jgi:triacylglycerol lipase
MTKKQYANNFRWSISTLFRGHIRLLNAPTNNLQYKDNSLLARTLRLMIFVVFCNTAAAIISPAQAADTAPSLNTIDCLFNWAQTFKPSLFSPLVSGLEFSPPYTYRYYPNTNAYVGVSSADNHVYYLRPDGVLQDVGDLSVWLATSGCGARPYPVIFIHGLASSADTWTIYRDYLINNGHWTFGGIPAYNQVTKTVDISCPVAPSQLAACTGDAGDFYTLNFSNKQGLTFDEQGGELAAIIKEVLAANPGKTKVLLISHSMGGLAAREYLQGLAREVNSVTTIPYRNDVAKLITIGAPHQGSFWAEECHNHIGISNISGNVGICDLLPLAIDPNSIALEDLKPNSSALNILNNLTVFPLPSTTSYVSIIGTGQPTLVKFINFKDGDGIVSDISQDLMTVTKNLPQQKSVKINIPFRNCGNKINVPLIGNLGETHNCETTDIDVGAEILRDLQ